MISHCEFLSPIHLGSLTDPHRPSHSSIQSISSPKTQNQKKNPHPPTCPTRLRGKPPKTSGASNERAPRVKTPCHRQPCAWCAVPVPVQCSAVPALHSLTPTPPTRRSRRALVCSKVLTRSARCGRPYPCRAESRACARALLCTHLFRAGDDMGAPPGMGDT